MNAELLKRLLAGRGPKVIGGGLVLCGAVLASGKVEVPPALLEDAGKLLVMLVGGLVVAVSAAIAAKPPEPPKA